MCKSPEPQHLSCAIASGAEAFMTSMAAVTGFWTQNTSVPTDNFYVSAAAPEMFRETSAAPRDNFCFAAASPQMFRESSRSSADSFYVPAPESYTFREVPRTPTDNFYAQEPSLQTFRQAARTPTDNWHVQEPSSQTLRQPRAPTPNFCGQQQAPCVLLLSNALQEAELCSSAVPTVGSAGHQSGMCKPCAFFYTKGCGNGTQCPFCHLCPPEEKRRRQKSKQEAFKEMRRQRNQVRL